MSEKSPKPFPRLSGKGVEKQKQREERRAELLRRNLAKRKAQQRLRTEDRDPET